MSVDSKKIKLDSPRLPMGFPPYQEQPIKQQTTPGPSPDSILYLDITYTLNPDGSVPDGGNIPYDYASDSGVYLVPGTLSTFLAAIQSSTPMTPHIKLRPGHTPNIEYPSYVVYSISATGPAEFTVYPDAIATDDTTPNEYFNLIHLLDDGTTVPGGSLGTSLPTSKCHIAYFSTICPSAKGYYDVADKFNLHVNVKQPDDSSQPGTIDPDIKNTGRPPGRSPFVVK